MSHELFISFGILKIFFIYRIFSTHYMTLTVLLSGSGLQLLVLVYTLLLLVFRLGRSSASCPAYKSAPVLV